MCANAVKMYLFLFVVLAENVLLNEGFRRAFLQTERKDALPTLVHIYGSNSFSSGPGRVASALKDHSTVAAGLNFNSLYGSGGEDLVWEALRRDASREASREQLLASFMHATILSQPTLERSLAFHLANQLASPAMISTQVQALFLEAFQTNITLQEILRRDIIAVIDRDPAVKSTTDVLLYFKGFQALQTHRVANWLWNTGRETLALFLHSRANSVYQIDIHPGARLGFGLFLDHGTGIVIGETAVVGNNVSMLHQVTLGGKGMQNTDRHPKIGDGVLIGAGATLLGNIKVGERSNIGARSMVTQDIPPYSVAVGVPAKIIHRIPSPVSSPGTTMDTTISPGTTMDTACFFYDI